MKWIILSFLLFEGLLTIPVIKQFTDIGKIIQLTCPDKKPDTWQKLESGDILAACENENVMTKTSILHKIHISKDCQNLTIEVFQKEDIGMYRCYINSSDADVQMYDFDIKIRSIIVVEANSSSNIKRIEGEYVTLTCLILGAQPDTVVYWKVGGTILQTNKSTSVTYQFIAKPSDHMKQFVCNANSSKDSYSLETKVQLSIIFKPRVMVVSHPSPPMVRKGQNITLLCQEESLNVKIINRFSWLQNGRLLNNNINTLQIVRADSDVTGVYLCNVKNIAGEDFDVVKVTVTYSPVVQNYNVTFKRHNGPITLKCEAEGVPNTYIFSEWRHFTHTYQLVRTIQGYTNGTLILPHHAAQELTYENSGIYICNVTNGIPDEVDQLWKTGKVDVINEGLPELVQPMKYIYIGYVDESSNVSIFVLSSSNVSKAHWFDERHMLLETSTCSPDVSKKDFFGKLFKVPSYKCEYVIQTTTKDDFQNYSVNIANQFGKIAINFSLVGKPETPRNVQVIALKVQIIVKWHIENSGGFLQVLFIEYRKMFELKWNVVSAKNRTSTVIVGLQMDTVYFVRVFSRTIIGDSKRSDEVIVKTGNQHLVIHTYSWEAGVITGATVVVFLFCTYGMGALVKRLCLKIEPNSNNISQSMQTTTVTHGPQYDEIDSMYYHHSNANELTLNNRPLEILLASNNGGSTGSISTSYDDTGDYYQETVLCDTDINISEAHNVSSRSSLDDSYLVPCRKYVNLEIGVAGERSEQIREQENNADCSSETDSDSSETVMKSDHHYETVTTRNIEDHLYENSIEPN